MGNATVMSATRTEAPRGRSTTRRELRPLRVAVTGASGTVGPSLLARLVGSSDVERVRVLSRRSTGDMPAVVDFDMVDVRDAAAIQRGVAGADVVVHMAFALYGVTAAERELFDTNVRGTLNVARAAVAAGARRLVYTSSAGVYGLRSDNPQPLRETDEIRACARHFYSRHKAQCELLIKRTLTGTSTAPYLLRPCAIVGPHAAGATMSRLPARAPGQLAAALRLLAGLGLRPWLATPPVPMQFVHEDDVAQAIERAVVGAGEPGAYNLAGDGVVVGPEIVRLLGMRALPVPRVVVEAALRMIAAAPPLLPALTWPALVTEPVLLDTTKARAQLGWQPEWDSRAALRATREALGW